MIRLWCTSAARNAEMITWLLVVGAFPMPDMALPHLRWFSAGTTQRVPAVTQASGVARPPCAAFVPQSAAGRSCAGQAQHRGCRPYDVGRSEERRVGKECRSRWSPDHYKDK